MKNIKILFEKYDAYYVTNPLNNFRQHNKTIRSTLKGKVEYEEFIRLYKKECEINYGRLHIMEKPREIGPLVLDYDLKQITSQRKLTSTDIMQVIECINEIIMKYYHISDDIILESELVELTILGNIPKSGTRHP